MDISHTSLMPHLMSFLSGLNRFCSPSLQVSACVKLSKASGHIPFLGGQSHRKLIFGIAGEEELQGKNLGLIYKKKKKKRKKEGKTPESLRISSYWKEGKKKGNYFPLKALGCSWLRVKSSSRRRIPWSRRT